LLEKRFKGPVHSNDLERIDQMIIKVYDSLKNSRAKSQRNIKNRSIMLDKLRMNTKYAEMFECSQELVNKMTENP
jgi:RNA-binding protein YlmH